MTALTLVQSQTRGSLWHITVNDTQAPPSVQQSRDEIGRVLVRALSWVTRGYCDKSPASGTGATKELPVMALLPGSVRAAVPGVRGFDTDHILDAGVLKELAAQYKFVRDYSVRSATSRRLCRRRSGRNPGKRNGADGGLSMSILREHLVTRRRLGTRYGLRTTRNAAVLGLPHYLTIWMDLEAISPDTQASDIIDHCNNWYDEVAARLLTGLICRRTVRTDRRSTL